MTNSELFNFTGKCLTLNENPEFGQEIIERCKADTIDWQQFVALCSNHLILPVIFLKFRSHGIIESLPDELSAHLSEIYQLNVKRNSRILRQLNEITRALKNSNICPVFLKGTGNLLDGLYSELGERILGDIDFLVPEKDYLLSAELLKIEGYSPVSEIPAYSDTKNSKHYPRLFHPEFDAVIEIHRLPIDEKYQSWFNSGIIDREKVTVSSLPGCYVASDKHKIVHNFIHSQLSNEGHLLGIISFRDLYDLYLLSKRFAVSETLQEIEPKQKAIAYFVFAEKVLSLPYKLYPKSNLQFSILYKKHSLNQNSSAFYQTYRIIVFIAQRIFIKYIGQSINSFYSARIRRSLIRRLSNRKWYGSHVRFYARFFNRNM